MYWLGYMYASGLGVSPDFPEAQSWYKKAADRGYALALYNIGLLYVGGGPGMSRDCNVARGWFEKAAARGVSVAQKWLSSNSSCQ